MSDIAKVRNVYILYCRECLFSDCAIINYILVTHILDIICMLSIFLALCLRFTFIYIFSCVP
jgi:hypothetical protein